MAEQLWYVTDGREIFVDMDKPFTSLPHAEKRLRGAIAAGLLNVESVEVHRSFDESHLHLRIVVYNYLSPIDSAIWALMFHSDIYRACNTIMRIQHCIPSPDLLITPLEFSRPPNMICYCKDKHTGEVMNRCPAAMVLRADARTRSFFGRPIIPNPETRVFPDNGTLSRIFDKNITFSGKRFA